MLQMQVVLFVFMVIFGVILAQDCKNYGQECQDEKDCCGGCCINQICRDVYIDCRRADDPCLEHYCPPDQECYIFQPNCEGCGSYVDCRNAPLPPLELTTFYYKKSSSNNLKYDYLSFIVKFLMLNLLRLIPV